MSVQVTYPCSLLIYGKNLLPSCTLNGADDGAGTMSEHKVSSLQKILKDERGQMLPLVAVMLVVLAGNGRLGNRRGPRLRRLSTTAGCQPMQLPSQQPNICQTLQRQPLLQFYTAEQRQEINAVTSLTNVGMASGYPLYRCLTSLNLACLTSSGVATGGANAVVVKQTGTVNTDLWGVGWLQNHYTDSNCNSSDERRSRSSL